MKSIHFKGPNCQYNCHIFLRSLKRRFTHIFKKTTNNFKNGLLIVYELYSIYDLLNKLPKFFLYNMLQSVYPLQLPTIHSYTNSISITKTNIWINLILTHALYSLRPCPFLLFLFADLLLLSLLSHSQHFILSTLYLTCVFSYVIHSINKYLNISCQV